MKSNIFNLFLLFATLLFTSSCYRAECINDNPVFNKFSPGTIEYKSELAKQIQRIGTRNLSYSFEKYLNKGGKEFIVIHIQGEALCATGVIQVNDWSKLIGMRREISGYRGAGLKGLEMEIKQDSTGTNFIYKDIDKIID